MRGMVEENRWRARPPPQNSGALKMKKIVLATAAVMALSSAAFAASDNYGSNGANQPAAAVDTTPTSGFAPSPSEKNIAAAIRK